MHNPYITSLVTKHDMRPSSLGDYMADAIFHDAGPPKDQTCQVSLLYNITSY